MVQKAHPKKKREGEKIIGEEALHVKTVQTVNKASVAPNSSFDRNNGNWFFVPLHFLLYVKEHQYSFYSSSFRVIKLELKVEKTASGSLSFSISFFTW